MLTVAFGSAEWLGGSCSVCRVWLYASVAAWVALPFPLASPLGA